MRQHILFVDDNPLMLAGLGRMLRPMRHEWEMTFELGGPAGLAALEAFPYDVVVSDMRMPEIDGAELLRDACRLQPRAMRIILSGQANHEASLRSVETAHQCLSKPCAAAILTGRIGAVLAWRNVLGGGEVASAVAKMTRLPGRPDARRALLAELQSPNRSARQLTEIVAGDLGMTCKVLQVANSAFFSNDPHQTVSVSHAVQSLGLDVLRQLAQVSEELSELDGQELRPFIDELSRHSIDTRDLSEVAAAGAGLARPMTDAASTAGLLHDVGKLVLATIYGTRYREMMTRARETRTPLWVIERDELGTSHVDVGAYLLSLWGIPDPIVDAVARHNLRGEGTSSESSPATVVQEALFTQRHRTDDRPAR